MPTAILNVVDTSWIWVYDMLELKAQSPGAERDHHQKAGIDGYQLDLRGGMYVTRVSKC